MLTIKIIILVICSYFFGNINSSVIITKIKKSDIRKVGSGNPGTMNMLRSYGVALGATTLVLDVLKGVIPCIAGMLLLDSRLGIYIGGLGVIVGHIFPVLLKFKGGKGIASSLGICMVINPLLTLICFAIGVVFLIVTCMGSITSFVMISFPLAMEGYSISSSGGNLVGSILIFCLFLLTLLAHRRNIKKLFLGKENPVVLFRKKKKLFV